MSVVIGIRCSDGIVLGSDSAASLMNQGMVTAQQRSMKKVAANGRVLSGITGNTGLGQRVRAELESKFNTGAWTSDRQSVLTQMRRHMFQNIVEIELRAAEQAVKTIGHASCADAARTESLIATVIDGKPELIHLNETCAPSLVEGDVPFASIGVGQLTADPFLAFVRRILWSKDLPTLSIGTFTVAWTLTHVIHANPNGIGDPLQIGVLERAGGEWVARELSAPEIQEHGDSVREYEKELSAFFSERDDKGAKSAPPPK